MTNKTQTPPSPRKPYSAPKLIRYGDVQVLTQAGATAPKENMGGMQVNSSRILKEDIARIGTHPFGFGLYLFHFKPEFRNLYGHERQFGVIAEEVETVMPRAVSVGPQGSKMVDYAMLGVRQSSR